jgi:hypothetical protein
MRLSDENNNNQLTAVSWTKLDYPGSPFLCRIFDASWSPFQSLADIVMMRDVAREEPKQGTTRCAAYVSLFSGKDEASWIKRAIY